MNWEILMKDGKWYEGVNRKGREHTCNDTSNIQSNKAKHKIVSHFTTKPMSDFISSGMDHVFCRVWVDPMLNINVILYFMSRPFWQKGIFFWISFIIVGVGRHDSVMSSNCRVSEIMNNSYCRSFNISGIEVFVDLIFEIVANLCCCVFDIVFDVGRCVLDCCSDSSCCFLEIGLEGIGGVVYKFICCSYYLG
jgi:hypothetical protein